MNPKNWLGTQKAAYPKKFNIDTQNSHIWEEIPFSKPFIFGVHAKFSGVQVAVMISPSDWEASASWMLDLYRLKCPCQDLSHHPSGNIQLLEFFLMAELVCWSEMMTNFNPPKSLDQHLWHHLQQFSTDWCYMMLTLWNFTSKIHLHKTSSDFWYQNSPPENHSAPSLALKGAPGQNPPKIYSFPWG